MAEPHQSLQIHALLLDGCAAAEGFHEISEISFSFDDAIICGVWVKSHHFFFRQKEGITICLPAIHGNRILIHSHIMVMVMVATMVMLLARRIVIIIYYKLISLLYMPESLWSLLYCQCQSLLKLFLWSL